MADGSLHQDTIRRPRADTTEGIQRVRQRVIVLEERRPGYCLRPDAHIEEMPWDDGPIITEVDDSTPLPSLDG
jgi:hypothetical protein